jgi:acyl transferase domain-containing protein
MADAAVASPARNDEPIAVIGIGCPLPRRSGRSRRVSPGCCFEGHDAVTETPADPAGTGASGFSENPDAPGYMVSRWGGFLEDIDQF